jgi:beta-lactamase class A
MGNTAKRVRDRRSKKHNLALGNDGDPAKVIVWKHSFTSFKKQLQSWMTDNKTGDAKLRAGLPSNWIVGDKTGGGANGTMADVAFVLAPDRQPVIVVVYMTETTASFDDRNAGVADIARALKKALA